MRTSSNAYVTMSLANASAILAITVMAAMTWSLFAHAKVSEKVQEERRERMVNTQIEARGIKDEQVLRAMRVVERHRFVPSGMAAYAYRDSPLPIGHDQTISQPYIVALMTELLKPKPDHKVLEVGTGSGYQAAVLAEIVKDVYSIEIVKPLGEKTRTLLLDELDYKNIHLRIGDGYQGWPDAAPFDGIIVTAAPEHIPQPLLDQLKVGGRMVIPVGDDKQKLMTITRTEDGFKKETVIAVRFVPMTGIAEDK